MLSLKSWLHFKILIYVLSLRLEMKSFALAHMLDGATCLFSFWSKQIGNSKEHQPLVLFEIGALTEA